MWQKRKVDKAPFKDFTNNVVGTTVILMSADVIMCPGCGQPGIVEPLPVGPCVVHKHDDNGNPTDVCVPQPEGASELIMYDCDGATAYSGPARATPGTEN